MKDDAPFAFDLRMIERLRIRIITGTIGNLFAIVGTHALKTSGNFPLVYGSRFTARRNAFKAGIKDDLHQAKPVAL
ncbi:MAG: hypothetical protein WB586_12980 [Chthoniobacterales bacterium]